MKSKYNENEAKSYIKKYAKRGVPKDLALRIYTTQLLGNDPTVVLHGGGNTSVKSSLDTLLGKNEEIIYVTHDQIEAMTMADEIVIMNNGIIEQIATPNEIYEKPNNLFVADFIGTPAINLLEGVVTDTSSIKLKSQDIPHSKKNVSNNQNVVYGIRPTDVSIDPSLDLCSRQ